MDNKILLTQMFSFWPQVDIIQWLPSLDNLTHLCLVNFKGHKTLLLLDELVYTSEHFGSLYLTGRMNQIKTLRIKYGCTAGIFITLNKNLPKNIYQSALIKKINLIDLDNLTNICHKLNCGYLINFLTINVNLDLIN